MTDELNIDEMVAQQQVPHGWVNERLSGLLAEYHSLEEALNVAWGAQQDAVRAVEAGEKSDVQALANARREGKKITVRAATDAKAKAAESLREVEAYRVAVSDTIRDIHQAIDEDFGELAGGLDERAGGHRERALALLASLEGEVGQLLLAERLKQWLAQPIVGRNGRLAPFLKWSRTMGDFTVAAEQIRGRVNTPVGELPRQRYTAPSAITMPGTKSERQSLGAEIVEAYHADLKVLAEGEEPVRAKGSVPYRLLPEEGALRADKAERQAAGAQIAAELQADAAGEAVVVPGVTGAQAA